MTGTHSEKCSRRFHHGVNIIECTYTDLDGIAYDTPRLYGRAYCSWATSLYSMLPYKTTRDSIKHKRKRCNQEMRGTREMYEATTSVTRNTVLEQTFTFIKWKEYTLK